MCVVSANLCMVVLVFTSATRYMAWVGLSSWDEGLAVCRVARMKDATFSVEFDMIKSSTYGDTSSQQAVTSMLWASGLLRDAAALVSVLGDKCQFSLLDIHSYIV